MNTTADQGVNFQPTRGGQISTVDDTIRWLQRRQLPVVAAGALTRLGYLPQRRARVDRTGGTVPRTEDELASLLRERPDHWEYYLYAGTLLVQRGKVETEYRDHVLGYADLSGDALDEAAAVDRLQASFPDAQALVAGMMRLFEPEAVERAFGKPDEPGDADLIQHLACRTIDGYASMMSWVRDLRGARVPAEFQTAFQLAADMLDNAVEEVRAYVDRVVAAMGNLTERLEARDDESQPLELTLELIVSVDEDVVEEFSRELERVQQQIGFS